MKIYFVFAILIFLSCSTEKVKENKESVIEKSETKIENEKMDSLKTKIYKEDFYLFLSNFKENTNKEIEENERIKFLGIKWEETEKETMFSSCVSENVLFESKEYIGLIYTIYCRAGGICETTYLAIFNKNGELIETITIGYTFGDLSFTKEMTYELITQNIIFLTIEETINDEEGEEIETKTRSERISIAKYSEN